MVIASVMVAFALSSYQKKIRRGYARAAEGFLSDLAGRQDTYYAKSRHYASDFGPLLGSTMAGLTQIYFDETTNLNLTASSPTARFSIQLTNPTGTGSYQLQMVVPSASKQWVNGECARWTLNNVGQRTSDNAVTGGTFATDATTTCWLE